MKTIQEGLTANDQMNKAIENIKASGIEMATTITKLIDASNSIAGITRDLAEISLQTKILALNAGVEAAHAGDQGATFAVVAEQIKEIAERCKKASDSTGQIIQKSLTTSQSAIAAGKKIETDIQSIVYHQYEISEVLNGLASETHTGGTGTPPPPVSVDGKKKLVFDVATMSTNHYDVDQQHRNLIDMINQLEEAVEQGRGRDGVDRLLNFLGEYVVKHFSMEEKLMAEHHCPATEVNLTAHKTMLKKYTDWREVYEASGFDTKLVLELKELLSTWLVSHVCKIDCQLRESAHAANAAK